MRNLWLAFEMGSSYHAFVSYVQCEVLICLAFLMGEYFSS